MLTWSDAAEEHTRAQLHSSYEIVSKHVLIPQLDHERFVTCSVNFPHFNDW